MNPDYLRLVLTIIQKEMGLKDKQVVVSDQEFPIPSDSNLYLFGRIMGSRNVGNVNNLVDQKELGMAESQTLYRREMYSITIYSSSDQARLREWEVPMALRSVYSEQVQEDGSFSLSGVPASMTNVTDTEGTKRLKKFNLVCYALVAYRKQKSVDYYDKFTAPIIKTNP